MSCRSTSDDADFGLLYVRHRCYVSDPVIMVVGGGDDDGDGGELILLLGFLEWIFMTCDQ